MNTSTLRFALPFAAVVASQACTLLSENEGTPTDSDIDADAGDAAPADAGDGAVPRADGGDGGEEDGGAKVDPMTLPASGVCSADGFCWKNPLPFWNPVSAVAVIQGDVWVAGRGTIAVRHGTTWRGRTALPYAFDTIAGASSTDVWFFAGAKAVHWDGAAFKEVATGSSFPIAGAWARASNDVWAVGQSGTILHWDGAAWTKSTSGTFDDLTGVHGFAADDAWAIGPNGARHWNGTAWGPSPIAGLKGYAMGGPSPNDLWTAGPIAHWDGAALTTLAQSDRSRSISYAAPDDVLFTGLGSIGGSSADVVHWDGARLRGIGVGKAPCPVRAAAPLAGVHVVVSPSIDYPIPTQPTSVCPLVTFDRLDPNRWGSLMTSPHGNEVVQRLLVLGPGDVWVNDKNLNGATIPAGFTVKAIGGKPNDVWASGDGGRAAHFDGTTWTITSVGAPVTLSRVSVAGPNSAWVVGGGHAYYWNGTTWDDKGAVAASDQGSLEIWGSGPNDAWVVLGTTVTHWDGAGWTPVPGLQLSKKLWGTAANDVYGHDRFGAVRHFDGTGWSPAGPSLGTQLFFAEWGGPHDLWASTPAAPELRRWNGASWSTRGTGYWTVLQSLSVTSAGPSQEVWVGGVNGSLLRRGP